MRSENMDSIVPRLKSFAQRRYSVLSLMETASTSSNHVVMVVSDSSCFNRSSTMPQMSATEFTEALLSFFLLEKRRNAEKSTPYIIPETGSKGNS